MAMTGSAIMLVALGLDALFGWPRPVHAVIGHPVSWIGLVIDRLDRWLNLDETRAKPRRTAGVVTALLVIGMVAELATVITWFLPDSWVGVLIGGALAWPLIAMRSMHDHVRAVSVPLASGDLGAARDAVAKIVGRDPARLDEAGVARASLESLAENTSDGIVAPVFWGLIFGLPGIAAYKAINTLDSMIGHRTPRYEAFGWASARIDDLANLIPARLTAIAFALVSAERGPAMRVMLRDARHHRSPNAGWPEAALAGALGVRLSGPRVYDNRVAEEPWVNAEGQDPVPGDIERGLGLYRKTMLLLAALVAFCALILRAG